MNRGNSRLAPAARGRRAVLAQLVSKAHDGTSDDLWSLYRFVVPQKQEEVTIGVVNVAAKHLSADYEPNFQLLSLKDRPYVDCALASMSVLHAVIMHGWRADNFKEAAVNRILEVIDQICPWIHLFLDLNVSSLEQKPSSENDTSEVHLMHAEFLWDLVSFDDRILDALSSTMVYTDLILRMWLAKDDGGQVIMDPAHRRGVCPLLMWFHDSVKKDETKQLLLERIVSGKPSLPTKFARAFVDRVHQARELAIDQKIGNPDPPIGYITLMFDTLRALTTFNYVFRRKMLSENYIVVVSETLDVISTHLQKHHRTESGRRILASMIGPVLGLTNDSLDPTRIVRNIRDLFASKYLFVLARVMAVLPAAEEKAIRDAGEMLHLVGRYMSFPEVLQALEDIWPALSLVIIGEMRQTMPRIASSWDFFGQSVFRRLDIKKKEGAGAHLCDNISCTRRQTALPSEFKECLRCSRVIYCSEGCQKEDWRRFHRSECGAASSDHFQRKTSMCIWGQRNRSFLAALGVHIYNSVTEFFDERVLTENAGHAFHETIPIVDLTTLRPGFHSRSLRDRSIWWTDPRVEHYPEYAKPRYYSALEEYFQGKTGPGVRYIDLIFPFNGDVLSLFVRVEKRQGQWKAAWSVPRTARTPITSPEMLDTMKEINAKLLRLDVSGSGRR